MPTNRETVNIQVVLNNGKFAASAKRSGNAMTRFGNTVVKQSNRITRAFLAFANPFSNFARALTSFRGIFFTIGIVKFVNIFVKLERSLTNVLTLIDDTNISLSTFSNRVKAISNLTGLGFDDLSSALFDIVSAGNDAADSLEILSVASRLAVAGNTDVASSAKALVAIMKTYNLAVEDAIKVSDILFAAQKVGITTIQRLSNNTGKVAPTARAAGLSIGELTASISALTLAGLSTDEAGTALRAILTTLLRPSEQAKEAARLLGIELSTSAIRGGRFLTFLEDVIEKTGGSAEVLGRLFNNVRAFGGFVNLSADSAKNLGKALDAVKDASGQTLIAFQKFEDTLGLNLNRLRSEFQSLAEEIIGAFKPEALDATKALQDFFKNLRRLFAENKVRIVATVKTIKDRLIQAAQFIRAAYEDGQLFNVLVASFQAIFQGLFAFGTSLAPIAVRFAQILGVKIGKALVQGVLGEISIALRGGETLLSFGGVSDEFIQRFTRAQRTINELRIGSDLAAKSFSRGGEDSFFGPTSGLLDAVQGIVEASEVLGDEETLNNARRTLRTLKQLDRNADALALYNQKTREELKTLRDNGITREEFLANAGFLRIGTFGLESSIKQLEQFASANRDALSQIFLAGEGDDIDGVLKILEKDIVEAGKKIGPNTLNAVKEGFGAGLNKEAKNIANTIFRDTFPQNLLETALEQVPAWRKAITTAIELAVIDPLGIITPKAEVAIKAGIAEKLSGAISLGLFDAARRAEEAVSQNVPLPPGFDLRKLGEQKQQVAFNKIEGDIKSLVATFKAVKDELIRARADLRAEFNEGIISGSDFETKDAALIQDFDNQTKFLGQRILRLTDELKAAGGNVAAFAIPQFDKFVQTWREVSTLQGDAGLFEGLTSGIVQASEAFSTFGKIGVQVGQSIATEFSSGLAQAFTSADANFAEFASNFLRRIAQMILQSLILKAINSAFGFGSPPQPNPDLIQPFLRFNTGTSYVPGPNVNRDVVPAMLTPGEAVIRKSSSSYYGKAIMAAINAGAIPREILAMFAGGSLKRGFNTFKFNSGTASVPSGGGGAGFMGQAVVLSGEQEFEKFIANGGDRAMLRFFRDNPDLIRGAISADRT